MLENKSNVEIDLMCFKLLESRVNKIIYCNSRKNKNLFYPEYLISQEYSGGIPIVFDIRKRERKYYFEEVSNSFDEIISEYIFDENQFFFKCFGGLYGNNFRIDEFNRKVWFVPDIISQFWNFQKMYS